MRKRLNILAIAVVLAVASFVFARYRYVDRNSATIVNPFKSSESARVNNPFMDKSLFGDWMKDEVVFAIILPVVFLAGGLVWALKK